MIFARVRAHLAGQRPSRPMPRPSTILPPPSRPRPSPPLRPHPRRRGAGPHPRRGPQPSKLGLLPARSTACSSPATSASASSARPSPGPRRASRPSRPLPLPQGELPHLPPNPAAAPTFCFPPRLLELDGAGEDRHRGPVRLRWASAADPRLRVPDHEVAAVAAWLTETLSDGIRADEIGILVRSVDEFPRARRAFEAASQDHETLVDRTTPGRRPACADHHARREGPRVPRCRRHGPRREGLLRNIASWMRQTRLHLRRFLIACIFYVACNRAREKLFNSGCSADLGISPGSPGGARSLGDELDAANIFKQVMPTWRGPDLKRKMPRNRSFLKFSECWLRRQDLNLRPID